MDKKPTWQVQFPGSAQGLSCEHRTLSLPKRKRRGNPLWTDHSYLAMENLHVWRRKSSNYTCQMTMLHKYSTYRYTYVIICVYIYSIYRHIFFIYTWSHRYIVLIIIWIYIYICDLNLNVLRNPELPVYCFIWRTFLIWTDARIESASEAQRIVSSPLNYLIPDMLTVVTVGKTIITMP